MGLWLAASVVAVGVVVLFFLVRRHSPPVPDLNRGLFVKSIPVSCSKMRLGVRELQVVPHGDSATWGFSVLCAEPAGCNATIELVFTYLSAGRPGRVSVKKNLMLRRGQTLHASFIQETPVVVDKIERVSAEVLASHVQAQVPTPLPW